MDTQEKMTSSKVASNLAEAQTRAEAGNYAGALASVRGAKALEPKNVYILAFEKQAEQLGTLETSHSLTDEAKADILDSIPSIIEKALELSRTSSGVTNVTGLGKPAVDLVREREEKAAALEWLKNQYFQHAHEYVRKGEYQHALAEIRRVYIIDADNRIARDFEKQIDQLAQLKTQHTTKSHPALTPVEPQGVPHALMTPTAPSPSDTEPLPVMTEEWSSPQQLQREGGGRASKPSAPPRKKGNRLLMVIIIIAALVLAFIAYWYYQRNVMIRKSQQSGNALTPAASEQFIGAPSQTEEQSFVVSDSSSDAGTDSPQVTQVPSEQPKKPPPSEKVADRSAAGTLRPPPVTASEPPQKQPDAGTRGASGSTPLQATPTPPALQAPSATEQNPPDTAAAIPFVAVEKEARIIRLDRPRFSVGEYQRGVEGQIIIQVRIDAAGKPVQTVTLKTTNDLLVQPVIDAIMNSQFAPAEMSTGPVGSWLTIPFKFARKD